MARLAGVRMCPPWCVSSDPELVFEANPALCFRFMSRGSPGAHDLGQCGSGNAPNARQALKELAP